MNVVRTSGLPPVWLTLGVDGFQAAFAAGYFAKIPAKAALRDAGLAELTSAERIRYILMNVAFGSGYFNKVVVKKALSEAHAVRQ